MTTPRDQDLVSRLRQQNDSTIVLVIADGLGGLPGPRGQTELEAAVTPTLDRLARGGVTGLVDPVGPGITCGSGPGHLALLGYDPMISGVGRGVLTALGSGFDLRQSDVAVRGNFCTVDDDGVILDRRAGRLPSASAKELVTVLREIEVDGVELLVEPVSDHRFLLVLRGMDLGPNVGDTDPLEVGVAPRVARALDMPSQNTATAVKIFVDAARQRLERHDPANMVLLRGFGQLRQLPSMHDRYGLSACAAATSTLSRGVARIVGMHAAGSADNLAEGTRLIADAWDAHDFFFLHEKSPDSAGEDGDFDAKVHAIEQFDMQLAKVVDLEPTVLVVTSDHSTPSQLQRHSWHPVPVLLSSTSARVDGVQSFGEGACAQGGLGRLAGASLMPLILGHAGRLRMFD